MESEDLSRRVWRDNIAVDDKDLNYHGSPDARKSRHVVDVGKGMLAFASVSLVEEELDIYLWSYGY